MAIYSREELNAMTSRYDDRQSGQATARPLVDLLAKAANNATLP